MATIAAKEVVVTWDGEPSTWGDYARKVRFQWEKTPRHKRSLLGSDLASRLTGRAWAVTPSLDHGRLGKRNGAKYLLRYLQERLCRTAVPDAGSRLEDLLIRMRRPLGMSMSQWANEVLENYRRLQRAMVRARNQWKDKQKKAGLERQGSSTRTRSEPQAEPPSPVRRMASTPASPTLRSEGAGLPRGLHGEEEAVGEERAEEMGEEPPHEPDDGWWEEPQWTEDEWRDWRRRQRQQDESSSGEDLPWDELEIEDMQVLPDEVLGWLLLRRANLSSASRLAVQASVQNSLMFRDIENALRDQEEELMQHDQHRHPGRKRTYWVEEEGAWGLLMTDGEDLQDELAPEIHWVGNQLPSDVYSPGEEEDEVYWSMESDGWHGYVMDNTGYWLETDGFGTYWSAEEESWDLPPEQQKELDEAFAVYEGKARSFLQSRQLQKAKGVSRGFYPLGMVMKGKGKGKRFSKKGKGKPSTSSPLSPTRPMFSAQATSSRGDVMAASTDSSGCFICGDRGHGWRNCPKRSNQSTGNFQGKGAKKGTYWIESLTPSSLSSVFMVAEEESEIIYDTAGYGVLDIGATETVTSLESLEKLLHLRGARGDGDPGALRVVANGRKPFRFGNGEVLTSESFVLLRQQLGERSIHLGMYTLNVEKVPILVGVKTLTKLGAIIDVKGRCMVLTSVSEDAKIPLRQSSSGHLLVDLTQNWLNGGQPLMFHEMAPSDSQVYMVQAAEGVECSHVSETSTPSMSIHELANRMHHVHESREDLDVMMVSEGVNQQAQPAGLEVLEDAMVLIEEHHDYRPLAQVTQDQRDRVMRSLITSSDRPVPTSSIPHGAQAEEDCGSQGRALRLQQDRADEQERPEMHRTAVPWGAYSGSSGTGIQDRIQQVCNVGVLPTLRNSDDVHPGIRVSRNVPSSRTVGPRHQGADCEERRGQGHTSAEEREDQSGCSGEVSRETASFDSGQEGSLESYAESEGPSKGRLPPGKRPPGFESDFHSDTSEGEQSRDEYYARTKGKAFGRDDSRGEGVQRASRRRRMVSSERGSKLPSVMEEPTTPEVDDHALVAHDNTTKNSDNEAHQRTTSLSPTFSEMMEHYEIAEHEVKAEGSYTIRKAKDVDSEYSGILPKATSKYDEGGDWRQLEKEDAAFVLQEAEKYADELEEIFTLLDSGKHAIPPRIMELCCESDSGITRMAQREGCEGFRAGIFNACDLLKKHGFKKAWDMLELWRPDVLWVSLPCGPTSPIQELNMLTPEGAMKIERKVAVSRRLAGKAVKLMERQLEQGGDVLQEWPAFNKGWNFASIRQFWNRCAQRGVHYEARVDGCTYGLQYQGELMKKPWLIRGTNPEVWQLHSACQGGHYHIKCEGGDRTRASALYPPAMCKRIIHVLKKIHNQRGAVNVRRNVLMAATENPAVIDPSVLQRETEQDLMRWSTELLRLHKRLGHPSSQAFVKMLRDRGANSTILTLASQLKCMDCQEASIPPSRRVTTLETAMELWEVVQVDNMEVTIGDRTYHFQVMVDEASSYGVVSFLFDHSALESRNATSEEIIESLQKHWIQYFGYPKKIKFDREGAHRGRLFTEWGESVSIEMEAIPAEAHGQSGKVERLIGDIKHKLLRYMRSSDEKPQQAAWAMMAAHNSMAIIGGYSPMQWVFGRSFNDSERLHEGPDLSWWSSLSAEDRMREKLRLKKEAEKKHLDYVLDQKLKQASHSRMPPVNHFQPGDLVFYRRYQPPTDRRERSHQLLDVPRRNVARWYGPGRILALETKVTYDGFVRQPHRIAWIISAGRLKRVTTDQLRFASDREKIASENSNPLATPWTFQDLAKTINRGEFDEEVENLQLRTPGVSSSSTRPMARKRSASRGRGGQTKRTLDSEESSSRRDLPPERRDPQDHLPGGNDMENDLSEEFPSSPTEMPMTTPGSQVAPTTPPRSPEEETVLRGGMEVEDIDVDRLLSDDNYLPFSRGQSGPLFQNRQFLEARARHERNERPHHVRRQQDDVNYINDDEEIPEEIYVNTVVQKNGETVEEQVILEDLVYAVTIPSPQNEKEWKAIVKEPSKFVAKKMAKGVEVSWSKLSPVQRQAMSEAKTLEIKEWLSSKVAKAAIGHVPEDRLMKMRWVLVFKTTDDPSTVKAKARLVVLGYTDPDLGFNNVKSPTLTRRSRQLLLQATTHRGWGFIKADAKAAFLQGSSSQAQRMIYGRPVPELAEAMQLEPGQAIQFLKAAYGLTIAPREFFLHVAGILEQIGFERMRTEPCLWRLRVEKQDSNNVTYKSTIGAIGSHVDDFLICGQESDPRWTEAVEKFHNSLRWSPWETPPLTHCGVHLRHEPDGGWYLDQSEFCSTINQVEKNGSHKEMTDQERLQCRAVLGSAQWRVYQTAPHHAAKLSHLQSLLPHGDRGTIDEVNRFVREIYGQKEIGLRIHQLAAEQDDDLVAVAWSDASLANRVDLSSTGGYIVGFVHRRMVDQGVRGPVNVMSWSSTKLKRVCRSSLAAETQSLSEAEQELMYVRAEWRELLGDDVDLRRPEEVVKKVKGVLVTDAKALYDAAMKGELQTSACNFKEKYTGLEVLGLIENLQRQETTLRWVNSAAQLADGMTKVSAQDRIRQFLEKGQIWNLAFDKEFISAKKRIAAGRPLHDFSEEGHLQDVTWLDLLGSTHRGM